MQITLLREHSVSRLNLILLGKKGAGKSATGNTIIGREDFSKNYFTKVQKEIVMIDGVNLDVYDIQGEHNPGSNKEYLTKNKYLSQLNESAPTVVLFVINTEIVTKDEMEKDGISDQQIDRLKSKYEKTIELIDNLPNWLRQNTWILFTRGDELETAHLTIEAVIEQNTELKKIIQKLRNRYHVFNNKAINNPDQVFQLIKKIKETQLKMPPKITYFPRMMQHNDDPLARRIVLLGKSGVGKSATANTILGENRFISELSCSSVTAESEVELAVIGNRNVTMVDTPGLFDTSLSAEDLGIEIGKCIYLSSPGPHAFLYVLPINTRFTKQEEEVVQKFEMMFGVEMRKYTIILFTQADQLEGKSPDTLIEKNTSLCRLVKQCGGFHVFNNKNQSNRKQVTELMEKIDSMVEKNGGSCFSNEMYMKAARIKQEEEEQRKKEEEDRQREEEDRQREEEKRQQELERIKIEIEKAEKRVKEREEKMKEQEQKLEEAKLRQEEKEKQEKKKVQQDELKGKNASKTEVNDGFNKFYQQHENHLTAAGEVGTDSSIVNEAGVGAALGASFGGLVGTIAGPAGTAIGAGAGAVMGGAVGAIVGIFKKWL